MITPHLPIEVTLSATSMDAIYPGFAVLSMMVQKSDECPHPKDIVVYTSLVNEKFKGGLITLHV